MPEQVQTQWGPVEQNTYRRIEGTLANCRSDNGFTHGTNKKAPGGDRNPRMTAAAIGLQERVHSLAHCKAGRMKSYASREKPRNHQAQRKAVLAQAIARLLASTTTPMITPINAPPIVQARVS